MPLIPPAHCIEIRKVPTSHHIFRENAEVVKLPFLKPSDMLQHLLREEPWLLLGGLQPGDQSCEMLTRFWQLYQGEHPTHAVYELEQRQQCDLSHCIPLLLHGDGGRTAKKQPLEVQSLLPVLGLDTLQKAFKCRCENQQSYGLRRSCLHPLVQRLNNRNSSYLTHFLLFAFPSKHYKKTPGLLMEMLRVISEDLADCCLQGLRSKDGQLWRFAVIGTRGDAEWHAKTGILSRSYQNVGHKNALQCCHECLAGDPLHPFENFRKDASWKGTLFASAPWQELPPFAALPFDVAGWQSGGAAKFFRRDSFHVFRLGIGRNFLGSAIISLALDGHFDEPEDTKNLADRLVRAWSFFSLWMTATGNTVNGLRSFSKEKLHFPTMNSFPYVGCKGSDTVVLLKWIRFFAGLKHEELLVTTADHGLAFQTIHGHGLWIRPSCRKAIERSVAGFLAGYAKLAQKALQNRRTLFSMVPKVHAFAHFQHDAEKAKDEPFTMNPGAFDTSTSEDFVGHVARQSRRISYKNIVENTVLAYKVRANLTIQRFKKARRL